MNNSIFQTIRSVLQFFNIPFTSDYVKKVLDENIDGDNLWGILTVLQIYGILVNPSKVITSNLNTKQIKDNTPFLTQYNENIILIKNISQEKVTATINGKETTYLNDTFFSNWGGIVISLNKGEVYGEPNYKEHRKECVIKNIAVAIIFCSIFILYLYRLLYSNIPFYIGFCFLCSVAGAIITLLIEISNHSTDGVMNQLCSIVKKSSCKEIRKNNYQYVTAFGFSYFVALSVFILLPLNNFQIITYIILLSSLELIWSITWQIIKGSVCMKCMIIQLIVIIMVLSCIPHVMLAFSKNILHQGVIFTILFTFIFCLSAIFVWRQITDNYKNRKEIRMLDLVKKKYLEDTCIAVDKVMLFLNPVCKPCKEEVTNACNLILNIGKSKIIPIVLSSNSYGEKIALSVLAGDTTYDILKRLIEWYSGGYKTPELFTNKYKIGKEDESRLSKVLKTNLTLAHKLNVSHTPAIISNGHNMPIGVSITDILVQ